MDLDLGGIGINMFSWYLWIRWEKSYCDKLLIVVVILELGFGLLLLRIGKVVKKINYL